jgi:hypothetical protein
MRSACLVLSLAIAPAQAPSVSDAQFTIDGRTVHAVLRLPLDAVDLLLRLDRDLDGQVSAAELDSARATVGTYVTKHLQVTVDGTPLPMSIERIGVGRDADASAYLEAAAAGQSPSRIGAIAIRSDFLTEISAAHRTHGQINIGGRADDFMFHAGAIYERRLAPNRQTSSLLVLAALLVIGALWWARRRTVPLTVVAALLIASAARADVIMSAAGLNTTLKTMERLTRESSGNSKFQLGLEADALASLMNQEVESHGMQERELLDLALSRTKELGVGIAYNREKKKFFYDGAAFADYLEDAPRGSHAAAAEFKLLSYQFYQSTGTDLAATIAAAGAKKRFLTRYPTFGEAAELRLYLAVDYRDVSRQYRDANDSANAEKYRLLARAECRRIARLYPGTDQAAAARQLLQRTNP